MTSTKSSRKTNDGYRNTNPSKDNIIQTVQKQKSLKQTLKPTRNINHHTKQNLPHSIAYTESSSQQSQSSDYKRHLKNQVNLNKPQHSLKEQNYLLKRQLQILQLQLKEARVENQLLKQQFADKEDSYQMLQSDFLSLQQRHIQLSKTIHEREQQQNIQTHQQLSDLKQKITDLTTLNHHLSIQQATSQRQQIKDRIIMKLQDELIGVKLTLQEERRKHFVGQQQMYERRQHIPLRECNKQLEVNNYQRYSGKKGKFIME